MKMMSAAFAALRIGLMVTVCLAASSLNIAAQTGDEVAPSDAQQHMENVETMLELLGVPAQVQKAAGDVSKLYHAKVDTSVAKPEVKELVDVYQKAVTSVVNEVLGWDALKMAYVRTYANKLTADEVAAVSAFLLSPEGQKFSLVQHEAAVVIQDTTQHLAEADLAPALSQLAAKLREGLNAIQNPQQQNTPEQ